MFRSIVLRKYLARSSKVISDHGKHSAFEIGQVHVTTRSDSRGSEGLTQEQKGTISKLQRQLQILEKKKQLMIKMSQMLTEQEQVLHEKLKGFNEPGQNEPDSKPKSSETE